jgi:hypothetical protein
MATDDDTLAAILAEISEPSPTISPLKSPAKRSPASDDQIPSFQQPPKRLRKEEDLKPIKNKLTYTQTRKAKASKSLSCPIGLQYRPKPHIRQHKNFQAAMHKICIEAEQKLLTLMIRQQEKNIQEDSLAIADAQSTLFTEFPADNRSQATNKKNAKHYIKPHTRNFAAMQSKFQELAIEAFMKNFKSCNNSFKVTNKPRDEMYQSVLLTDSHITINTRNLSRNNKRYLRLKTSRKTTRTFYEQIY